jgi:hypothetical protein
MNAAHGSKPSWAFRKNVFAIARLVSPEAIFDFPLKLDFVVKHLDPPPAPTLGSPAHRVHCRMRMVGRR